MKSIGIAMVGLLVLAISAFGVAAHGGMFGGYNEDAQVAIENGDYEAWKEARMADLTPEHFADVKERHQGREEHRMMNEEVEQALVDGDYDAWVEAKSGLTTRWSTEITEDDFLVLSQIHKLREAGDYEGAMELREESGLTGFMGNGRKGGCGMRGAW